MNPEEILKILLSLLILFLGAYFFNSTLSKATKHNKIVKGKITFYSVLLIMYIVITLIMVFVGAISFLVNLLIYLI